MDKRTRIFIVVGLALALGVAAFLSPWASQSPDGLERVAQDKGFMEKGEAAPAWQHAPLRDYEMPGVKHKGLSTALAGVLGSSLVFVAAFGGAWLLSARRRRKESLRPQE